MSTKQIKEYEKLDNIREAAMLFAEKHCRHLYMGGVKWNPQLTSQRAKIDYIKACISRRKGTKITARTLIRKAKKAGFNANGMKMNKNSSFFFQVLEGQNILVTISGKKNRVRVYYLSWLKSKILRTDNAIARRAGWINVGDLQVK